MKGEKNISDLIFTACGREEESELRDSGMSEMKPKEKLAKWELAKKKITDHLGAKMQNMVKIVNEISYNEREQYLSAIKMALADYRVTKFNSIYNQYMPVYYEVINGVAYPIKATYLLELNSNADVKLALHVKCTEDCYCAIMASTDNLNNAVALHSEIMNYVKPTVAEPVEAVTETRPEQY